MAALPDLLVGTAIDSDEEILIRGDQRFRGVLLQGQPGSGKTNQLVRQALQDIRAGAAVLWVDPHNSTQQLLARIPRDRVDDVVLLSLVPDEVPLWPLLECPRREDLSTVANLLVDSWRAQHGDSSIGARASNMLLHALRLLDPDELSPLELLSALNRRHYRVARLAELDLAGMDFPLELYWGDMHSELGEHDTQVWASVLENKLSILLDHDWLARATAGVPPASVAPGAPRVGLGALNQQLDDVVLVRDGTLVLRKAGSAMVMRLADHIQRYLIRYRGGAFVTTRGGEDFEVGAVRIDVDDGDQTLADPSEEELATYGPAVRDYVQRRRMRRAFGRFNQLVLRQRGIRVREAINLSSMLDDGKIVMVEIPATYGPEVQQTVATFVLMAATMRGQRQLGLPPSRQVPVSVYVDEAERFLSAGVETTLAELRKAQVALTIAVQRLGQMGGTFADVRRAVVDTVGTVISMSPGKQEAAEIADLMHVPTEELLGLERGEGFYYGLGPGGAHQAARKFQSRVLEPAMDDISGEARRLSIDRHYQRRDQAEAVIRERVDKVRRIASAEAITEAARTPGTRARRRRSA